MTVLGQYIIFGEIPFSTSGHLDNGLYKQLLTDFYYDLSGVLTPKSNIHHYKPLYNDVVFKNHDIYI